MKGDSRPNDRDDSQHSNWAWSISRDILKIWPIICQYLENGTK